MDISYFETLPIHPQPKALESLTSYLTRLVEANQISTVRHLSRLCFAEGQGSFERATGDYPPAAFGTLPQISLCSEARLRATTFHHLGQKFGRLTQAQPLSQFLSGSVAKEFRYCPHCLVEAGYYHLTWRFVALQGCPQHGCRLLNRCGHCGQAVPLLVWPLKLGICPTCEQHLGQCAAEALSQTAWQTARAQAHDLAYLLSPQPYEKVDSHSLKQRIGTQFTRWRQLRRLRVGDVAEVIEQSVAIIYYLEEGPAHRGVKFCWYMAYADYLWIDLQTVFETRLPPSQLPSYEEKLVTKVKQAISTLEQPGQALSQTMVAQMIGIHLTAFTKYPRVRALWAANRARWREAYIAELVAQVYQAAKELEQAGHRITKNEISRQMGRRKDTLTRYPQVVAALEKVAGTKDFARREQRRGTRLLELAQAALTELESEGQLVTKQAISKKVGVSVDMFKSYAPIKAFLDDQVSARVQEHRARHRQHREQQLVRLIEAAVETLQSAGQPVTQKAILATISLHRSTVTCYPGAYACLQQVTVAPQSQLER